MTISKNEDGFYNFSDIKTYKDAKQFLNAEFGKDWHDKIDIERLDMNDFHNCILGQLTDNFIKALHMYFNTSPIEASALREYYFGSFGCNSQIDWKAKIMKRRAKRAV